MSSARTRPSAVILDLLRSSRGRQRSVRSLIAAGALFGFTDNTMRVTLSRLVGRGLIESPARGRYRLTGRTDALNDFVERWRLGEARVRPWNGADWLLAHVPAPDERCGWALEALGFRAARTGLFVRPANLALDVEALQALGASIGLDPEALLCPAQPSGAVADAWWALWDPRQLADAYADACARLQGSLDRLESLDLADAKLECFRLGGEMIHRLAKDPLLPAAVVDASGRERLWRLMLDYDERGQQIWMRGAADTLRQMPRPQLQVTA